MKEFNLGTNDDPKAIFVSALLSLDEVEEYYQLLLKYKDAFAWTYKRLARSRSLHCRAPPKPGGKLVKQVQRYYQLELIPQIEAKIDKLIKAW